MLARTAVRSVGLVTGRRAFHVTARALADEAAEAAAGSDELRLTLAVPDKALVDKREVSRVTVPGRAGTYGIQKKSPPSLSELRPGVVDVDFGGKEDNVKYFIPGGFAFTHADNTVDVSAPECVLLDEIDADMVRTKSDELKAIRDANTAGSREHTEAVIGLEVYKGIGHALGISV